MKRTLVHCRVTSHHYAVRKVTFSLLNNLVYDEKINQIVLAVNKNNIDLFKQKFGEKYQLAVIPIHSDNALLNQLFNILILPFMLLKWRIDQIIFPQISFFVYLPAKSFIYIHDLIEFSLANQTKIRLIARKFFFRLTAYQSKHIFTVSHFSKSEIVHWLNVKPNKVTVAYNGIEHNEFDYLNSKAQPPRENIIKILNSKYFLYVGYLAYPQKNINFSIEGFERLVEETNSDISFILVGKDGPNFETIHNKIKTSKYSSKIYRYKDISEVELNLLYGNALSLVYCSLAEGFGMPVAEAMALGCPVICSNKTSLPEVAGDASILIEPDSISSLVDEMKNILELSNYDRSIIAKKQKENAKKFSWHEHGRIVSEVVFK